jgi:5-dehydro-4-deoxyglucarate dehydratase
MERTPNELRKALRGLIGFGVTPFHADLSVHEESLRQNAASLAASCDVVVALGNNGEVYSLAPEEQQLVGRTIVEEVHGSRPVLVGVGFSQPVACELAKAAEDYKADGVLALPPHLTHAGDDGLFEYYRSIAAATRLAVLLFQTPALNFSPDLLLRLTAIPNIVGLKDEHGDMKHFVKQMAVVGERLEMLCGVGEILAPSYFAIGAKGFTSGIVNFMPATPVKLLDRLRSRRFEEAARIGENEVLAIFALRAKCPGYTTVVIKEAMNLCGLNAGGVRPPLAPLAEADREQLRSILKGLQATSTPYTTN